RKRFALTTIGYVHVCELRLAQGKLFMFLAISRQRTADPIFGGTGQQAREANGLRPRRLPERQHQSERRRLPERGGRGLPLPDPDRPDRPSMAC
ncbi:MAG TPA: hypothetical protein VHL31_08830, partial [Geminicoccus sp.]